MKYFILSAVILFGIVSGGCGDKQKEQAELEKARQDSIRIADSTALAEKQKQEALLKAERRKAMEQGDDFVPADDASLQGKIKEGKIILLSEEGETIPFRLEGSKILAVGMPDGKLYQVEKDGDKIMLVVPGKGKMERKSVNGKIYLVDNDDQMYEVKVENKKLIAVLDDGSEVNLAKK